MIEILTSLFYLLIFPGFLFLSVYGLALEYVDRKLYARFQNRIGPPWFQPFADIIKLVAKETIVLQDGDKRLFRLLPVFALASATTAVMYIPIWQTGAAYSFNGDLIIVMYLLTIPTLTFALAGWNSTSLFAAIGSVRTITQLFAYEVPLLMALLGPALFAGSWSISEIALFYSNHPLLSLINIPAFIIAIIATQGKLERVPFDIPEAETEIVAGSFTEYSGRLLAIFRMTIDTEMVVVAALLGAIFIPFWVNVNPFLGVLVFILKTLFVVFILAAIRSAFARLRMEQMVDFCWKYLAPIALLQILIDLILKGVLVR